MTILVMKEKFRHDMPEALWTLPRLKTEFSVLKLILWLSQVFQTETLSSFYVDGIELDNTASFESGKVSNLSLDLTTSSDVPTKVSNRVSEAQKSSGQIDVKVPEAASKENSGVEDIRITVNQDAENREINEVNITVSNKVEENQGEVGDIPVGDQENNVHGNIDVDTDNNDAVESSRINFRVRKDRIGDTSEVVLFHYDERELIEALDTNYLEDKTEGRSDDYYYFESDTTSFSSFTIASDNQDPDAEIDVNSTDIQAGDTVEFDSSDSSDAETEIRSYDWNFGGGEGSDSGQKVSHTYDEEGDYTVVLTVTDQGGNEDTSTVEISVEDIQTGSSNSQDTEEEEPEQQEQTKRHNKIRQNLNKIHPAVRMETIRQSLILVQIINNRIRIQRHQRPKPRK